MVVSSLRDLMEDVTPSIRRWRVNGSTVAGALVRISENGGVTMTNQNFCGGNQTQPSAFAGVALTDSADNAIIAIAEEPSIVYVNITGPNISAGRYICPDSTVVGAAVAYDSNRSLSFTVVGKVQDFYSSTVAKVKLMDIPNYSC